LLVTGAMLVASASLAQNAPAPAPAKAPQAQEKPKATTEAPAPAKAPQAQEKPKAASEAPAPAKAPQAQEKPKLIIKDAPAQIALPEGPARPKLIRDKITLLEQQVDALTKDFKAVTGIEAPTALRERSAALQAELDEIAVQIGEMQSKNQGHETAATQHSARLDAMASEIEKLWEENKALKEQLAAVKANPMAGYDKGFFIRTQDKKFELWLNGYVRPYYRAEFQEQWQKDSYGELVYDDATNQPIGGDTEAIINEFGFNAARLSLKVKLFGLATGVFEPDYQKLAGKAEYPPNTGVGNGKFNRVKVYDYALSWKSVYGEIAPFEWLTVRGGQFKVPFDRETLVAANQTTFSSLSLMTSSYKLWGEYMTEDSLAYHWDYATRLGSSFGYDRGLQLAGKLWEKRFSYGVGAFNGGGANRDNDNTKLMYALRLQVDPLGEMTAGMSDLDRTEKPLLSIGAAFAYNRPENKNPVTPEDKKFDYYSEEMSVTGDALFKWNGLHVMGAFFFRTGDHGNAYPENNTINTIGYMAQAGWFFPQVGLEPAFRYSGMDANLEREGDNVHELTGAVNYYFKGHNLKVGAEYTAVMMNDMTRTYLAPFGTWEDFHHRLTILAQLGF
jgi:hypothetical protein